MYLEFYAKGIFALALLGKKLEFHTEICVYFKYLISKYRIFRRVKEWSKSNQTRYGEFHAYLECNAKRIFAIAFLGKKLEFLYGKLRLFQINNFKNRSFSYGQGLVEIKPNSVWSIPCVPRL